jgi:hypothetical protein
MFGYSSYLDKSMNGIKTISDGVALIQNGNATFNTINVETITSSNLTDCNLNNCTTNDPTTPQSVVNKEYVDDNFVDRTNNLNQDINGVKTFLSVPICSTNALNNNQLVNFSTLNAQSFVKPSFNNVWTGTNTFNSFLPTSSLTPSSGTQLITKTYVDDNFVYKTGSVVESITGQKTFSNSCIAGVNFTVNTALFCNTLNARNPSVNTPRTLFTNLTTASTITIGTNNTPITIDSTTLTVNGNTTFNNNLVSSSQATFNNFTPFSNVASPTANNHLTRKDYIDNNFVYKTGSVMESITGEKTFSSNVNCSSSLTFLDTGTNSLIKQNAAVLNIENLTLSSSIKLKTRASAGAVLDSLTLSSSQCEILCQGLLLTSSSNISILSPNNLIGTINLFNTLSTGTIILGSGTSSNTINGNSTFGNNLTSNGQATFNNYTPFSNVASPTANNHLTRKDYVDNNFLDRTNNLTQNINGLKTFTDDLTAPNIYCNTSLYFRDINSGLNKALIFHQADIVYFDTLTVFDNYWKFKCFNIEQVVISQLSSTFNNKLISLAQARFENFTPTCLVSTPTQINHLTRKDYVDNNFVYKTGSVTENINGLKTFDSNTRFNSSILLYSGTNQSTIEQFVTNLYITNLFNTGGIYLRTSPLQGGTQNSLIINTSSCDILPPTLNLTSAIGTISILAPNSVSGIINLFTSTNNTLNIGTLSSMMNVEPPTTFSSDITTPNIFCNTALYLNNTTYSSILVQNTDILNFDANFNNNKFQFKVSSNAVLLLDATNTTIYNNLNSLSQAAFSNFTPICSVASPTANDHLTRKDYIDNNFMNLTTAQTKIGQVNFLNQITFNGGSGGGAAIVCNNGLNANTFLNVAGQATFNNFTPICSVSTPTANNELVRKDYVDNAVSGSSILSLNNTFTGLNTFNLGASFLGSLSLNNSGTFTEIEQTSSSQLVIRNTTNDKKIILSTKSASTGQIDNLTITTTSCNFQVPLNVSIGASRYSSFTSDTIGYKTPTGSVVVQSLSNGSGVNSGQLILAQGVWKIDYTATINITTTMTTLTSLEVFVANSSNVDLDIQGLDVKNFYGVGVTATQKIKISASGTVVNGGTSTTYNLRLIPVFTGGAGNFSGNIVATRLS